MTLTRPVSLLITFSFLALAVVLYVVGMVLPATVLLIGGAIAELAFWVRVFRHRR